MLKLTTNLKAPTDALLLIGVVIDLLLGVFFSYAK
jgi:hypothetical protein